MLLIYFVTHHTTIPYNRIGNRISFLGFTTSSKKQQRVESVNLYFIIAIKNEKSCIIVTNTSLNK